ncbi:DUF1440 domain-containing protein [Sutterella seckii]|uniref:DUF1440 domain-containing protein n=1 Tax=Sutterella seckii TaxID=1944635 RepID=A0A6I1EMG9_9BURK|nr:DUF1440 domain-containing protein [Sutterella seckii]KAB7653306.1 DUF1440 domain-containing protein [Sutterella seckii]
MQLKAPTSTRDKIILGLLLGLVAGIVVAFAKFGWEVPFPPRTPLRDATNPPQELLQQLGFSFEFTHTTYEYSGNPRPIVSFVVHFGFSIFFAMLYCCIAEYWAGIKKFQGALYGIILYFAFHVVIMPLMGTVPAPWDQPFAEHFSEFFGHAFCFWLMEVVRRDMRSRWTGLSDPEYGSVPVTR